MCAVARTVDALDPVDREIAQMVIGDKEGADDSHVVRMLAHYGELTPDQVADHRSGDCGCH